MSKTKIQEKTPTLKFKITNLRTSAFPGPLDKSDYLEFQVGDYVAKGSENTIYEVRALTREAFEEREYLQIHKEIHRYGSSRDNKLLSCIDNYKKNGSFGACYISITPIIRGEKIVAKGRLVKFNELEHSPVMNGRGYRKVQLADILRAKEAAIRAFDNQIARLETKKLIPLKSRNAIREFIALKSKTTKIEVMDSSGKVAATIEVKDLL